MSIDRLIMSREMRNLEMSIAYIVAQIQETESIEDDTLKSISRRYLRVLLNRAMFKLVQESRIHSNPRLSNNRRWNHYLDPTQIRIRHLPWTNHHQPVSNKNRNIITIWNRWKCARLDNISRMFWLIVIITLIVISLVVFFKLTVPNSI